MVIPHATIIVLVIRQYGKIAGNLAIDKVPGAEALHDSIPINSTSTSDSSNYRPQNIQQKRYASAHLTFPISSPTAPPRHAQGESCKNGKRRYMCRALASLRVRGLRSVHICTSTMAPAAPVEKEDQRQQKQLHAGNPIHFVLVPFMAQGHMIPTFDLARLLAERGMVVSLITTPFNLPRLKPAVDRLEESGLPISLVPLEFPTHEWGLPRGCENIDTLQASPDDLVTAIRNFFDSTVLLAEQLKSYIRRHEQQHQSLPICLVSDFCLPWTRQVSSELGIPRFVFYSVCCFTLCCHHFVDHNLPPYNPLEDRGTTDYAPETTVAIPDLPRRVEIARGKALGFFPGTSFEHLKNAAIEAERTADGIVVNTFTEMESDYIDIYCRAKGTKVYPVGPVSLCNETAADKASRGGRPSADESEILTNWLDLVAKPKSVIYASLGSITRTTPAQAIEMGLGLEASGHPFIWALKAGERMEEVESWLRENGFEERNRGRGLVIRGWAPQVMILSHPAVGGFLTHCGWNSCMEGVAAGVPMLTWPCFADQFFNEKFIVEVLGTGVPAGAKEVVFWVNDVELVKRGDLAKGVDELMGTGDEAEERRRKAEMLTGLAKKAMEAEGSSYINMSSLVDDVMHLALMP